MLFCLLLIFLKPTFLKNSFGNTIRVSNNRLDVFSGLIWDQTVCKGYQQTALVGKELTNHKAHFFLVIITAFEVGLTSLPMQ